MKYIPPLNALPGEEEDQDRSHWNADPSGNNVPLREGAYPSALGFEAVQREIVNVIKEAEIDPSNENLGQLHEAIAKLISEVENDFIINDLDEVNAAALNDLIAITDASDSDNQVKIELSNVFKIIPEATNTEKGTVEKATTAEVAAETTGKYPDAESLRYHPGIAAAWVNFNAVGVLSVRDSYGISSITDNDTGLYTANFSFIWPDTNYIFTSTNTISGYIALMNDTSSNNSYRNKSTSQHQLCNVRSYDNVKVDGFSNNIAWFGHK